MTTSSSDQSALLEDPKQAHPAKGATRFSVDTWAVAVSLVLSLLVWLGLLKHIPW